MNLKLFTLFLTGTLMSFFLLGASASTVNYSASDCKLRSGGAVAFDFSGAISNNSTTTTAFVVCHVPHTDFDGFLHTGAIDSGWFQAIDLSNTQNVACRFRGRALNANGSLSQQFGATFSTSGFGTQRQHLNMSGVGETSTSAYVLACEIPPRTAIGTSKVFTYQVNQ